MRMSWSAIVDGAVSGRAGLRKGAISVHAASH
jgi:hypothetical protein